MAAFQSILQYTSYRFGLTSEYITPQLGGMQALEWALIGGDFVRSVVSIGCGAAHTAWQIAISETQRQAIYADPNWNNGDIDPLCVAILTICFVILYYTIFDYTVLYYTILYYSAL